MVKKALMFKGVWFLLISIIALILSMILIDATREYQSLHNKTTFQELQIKGLTETTKELKNSVNTFWIFVNKKEWRIAE